MEGFTHMEEVQVHVQHEQQALADFLPEQLQTCAKLCQQGKGRMPTIEEGFTYLQLEFTDADTRTLIANNTSFIKEMMRQQGFANAMQEDAVKISRKHEQQALADFLPEQLQTCAKLCQQGKGRMPTIEEGFTYLQLEFTDADTRTLIANNTAFIEGIMRKIGFFTAVQLRDTEEKAVRLAANRIDAWLKGPIDFTKIRSAGDLQQSYLKQNPKDAKIFSLHGDRFDRLFVEAFRRMLSANDAVKEQAKSNIANRINNLLRPEDIENEAFHGESLFVAAMLGRLQGDLMQYLKPDSLYKELEIYATILIEKLYSVWQKKHEALESKETQAEYAQIENAISEWKPDEKKPFTTFHDFQRGFLQECPCREIAKKYESFTRKLLTLKWAQYSRALKDQETATSDQPEETVVLASESMRAQTADLHPAIASVLVPISMKSSAPSLDAVIQRRFRSVDWDVLTPELKSFLHQSRLSIGSKRVQRLAQSGKVEALFSGREDKLAPFTLAMCGALEGEEEIQRCLRELELSDSPKDTIRIMFASDKCRKAAQKVRRGPKIWSRFVDSLSSVGVSLKDLHLESEDEDRSGEDVDTEMLQEVDEHHEVPEEEQQDQLVSPIKEEHGSFRQMRARIEESISTLAMK